MKKLLFVNACVRGREISRTYDFAKTYIDTLNSNEEYEVEEVDLMEVNPPYHTYSNFSQYEKASEDVSANLEKFTLATQFAQSDYIVVAAPFWEFAFPAILSAYIENISVAGIAFKYTDRGSAGLCKATKLVYVSTIGDFIRSDEDSVGEKLWKRLSKLYGIEEFESYYAEGLDAYGADVEKIMQEAKRKITNY